MPVNFIVSIMFMKNIMYKLKLLTEYLESPDLNITDATLFITSALKSLDIINADSQSMDNLIKSAVIFLKNNVDAKKEYSVCHRCRIAPKHLDINNSNASQICFRDFYRKEFKIVLDTLTSLIRHHLEKSINDIKPLYNLFKPPLSRSLLTETLVQEAV